VCRGIRSHPTQAVFERGRESRIQRRGERAVSCVGDDGPFSEAGLTDGEIDTLDLDVANLVCEVEGVPLFDLDTIPGFFKDDIVTGMTPTISKALNKLLKQETPLPNPVCSE